ncbi:MAG TPA: permease-like cell division protein FtsX [Syntrophomonadaceae bacterium]|jgi:cell division transport system permease protein|nr:permease-like cell division protein FtsX [Syntrophomonadaceae bacterium]
MNLKNFGYFIKEALISMSRNRVLSLATVTTMAICILFLGVAVLLTINAGNFMNQLESDIQMIAYLDDALTDNELQAIESVIKDTAGVQEVTFVPKEEALQRLQAKFSEEDYDLQQTLGKNPLPNSFEIKAVNPQEVAQVAQVIGEIPGIYKVNYGQGVVERLFQVTKWVRILSIVFMVILALGAIFLIATTIRLAIFSRRKEIYLMKLIGATDWFVRWPFFIEGILIGVIGALIAIGLLSGGYTSLINNAQTALFFIPLVSQQSILIQVYLALAAVGVSLGTIGTYISINRFLNV